MILALTEHFDGTASKVIEALRARGETVESFPVSEYPQKIALTIALEGSHGCYSFSHGGRGVDLDAVDAVWYRTVLPPTVHSDMSSDDIEFARREARHVILALWRLLANRFWVNPWSPMMAAESKPYQLRVAPSVGLDIPPTLITNDPAKVGQFFDRCEGRMVYKACTPYHLYSRALLGRATSGIFTNPVSSDQLLSQGHAISLAPCIFQKYVEKEFELRVTIVGEHVFPALIRSQESPGGEHDWRHAAKGPAMTSFTLPDEIERKLLALMARLGLFFGCVDMVVTPERRFVFLEVNANGQWYWIQEQTGMPILQALAEALARGRRQTV